MLGKNAEDYAIKARAMADNALRRPLRKSKVSDERPETSRTRNRRIQQGCAESMGALTDYTMNGYKQMHRKPSDTAFAMKLIVLQTCRHPG